MARKGAAAKRIILPDPVYNNDTVSRFVNRVMQRGKKALAERIVYQSLDRSVAKLKTQILERADVDANDAIKMGAFLLDHVLEKVSPTVEVRSRRVGGATYQVPRAVNAERGVKLAMGWIIKAAQDRSEKGKRGEQSMVVRLSNEFCDAFEGRGGAIKKRETIHATAKANQAFAHFDDK